MGSASSAAGDFLDLAAPHEVPEQRARGRDLSRDGGRRVRAGQLAEPPPEREHVDVLGPEGALVASLPSLRARVREELAEVALVGLHRVGSGAPFDREEPKETLHGGPERIARLRAGFRGGSGGTGRHGAFEYHRPREMAKSGRAPMLPGMLFVGASSLARWH